MVLSKLYMILLSPRSFKDAFFAAGILRFAHGPFFFSQPLFHDAAENSHYCGARIIPLLKRGSVERRLFDQTAGCTTE